MLLRVSAEQSRSHPPMTVEKPRCHARLLCRPCRTRLPPIHSETLPLDRGGEWFINARCCRAARSAQRPPTAWQLLGKQRAVGRKGRIFRIGGQKSIRRKTEERGLGKAGGHGADVLGGFWCRRRLDNLLVSGGRTRELEHVKAPCDVRPVQHQTRSLSSLVID